MSLLPNHFSVVMSETDAYPQNVTINNNAYCINK